MAGRPSMSECDPGRSGSLLARDSESTEGRERGGEGRPALRAPLSLIPWRSGEEEEEDAFKLGRSMATGGSGSDRVLRALLLKEIKKNARHYITWCLSFLGTSNSHTPFRVPPLKLYKHPHYTVETDPGHSAQLTVSNWEQPRRNNILMPSNLLMHVMTRASLAVMNRNVISRSCETLGGEPEDDGEASSAGWPAWPAHVEEQLSVASFAIHHSPRSLSPPDDCASAFGNATDQDFAHSVSRVRGLVIDGIPNELGRRSPRSVSPRGPPSFPEGEESSKSKASCKVVESMGNLERSDAGMIATGPPVPMSSVPISTIRSKPPRSLSVPHFRMRDSAPSGAIHRAGWACQPGTLRQPAQVWWEHFLNRTRPNEPSNGDRPNSTHGPTSQHVHDGPPALDTVALVPTGAVPEETTGGNTALLRSSVDISSRPFKAPLAHESSSLGRQSIELFCFQPESVSPAPGASQHPESLTTCAARVPETHMQHIAEHSKSDEDGHASELDLPLNPARQDPGANSCPADGLGETGEVTGPSRKGPISPNGTANLNEKGELLATVSTTAFLQALKAQMKQDGVLGMHQNCFRMAEPSTYGSATLLPSNGQHRRTRSWSGLSAKRNRIIDRSATPRMTRRALKTLHASPSQVTTNRTLDDELSSPGDLTGRLTRCSTIPPESDNSPERLTQSRLQAITAAAASLEEEQPHVSALMALHGHEVVDGGIILTAGRRNSLRKLSMEDNIANNPGAAADARSASGASGTVKPSPPSAGPNQFGREILPDGLVRLIQPAPKRKVYPGAELRGPMKSSLASPSKAYLVVNDLPRSCSFAAQQVHKVPSVVATPDARRAEASPSIRSHEEENEIAPSASFVTPRPSINRHVERLTAARKGPGVGAHLRADLSLVPSSISGKSSAASALTHTGGSVATSPIPLVSSFRTSVKVARAEASPLSTPTKGGKPVISPPIPKTAPKGPKASHAPGSFTAETEHGASKAKLALLPTVGETSSRLSRPRTNPGSVTVRVSRSLRTQVFKQSRGPDTGTASERLHSRLKTIDTEIPAAEKAEDVKSPLHIQVTTYPSPVETLDA